MASTAENILARAKRLLAEENAKLVEWRSVKIARTPSSTPIPSIRMIRKWERIDDLIRHDLENYLNTYTSVSNNDAASLYVTDPWADGEVRAGRWRMVKVWSSPVKTNPEEQGIYQMLMYWPVGYEDFGDFCAEASPLHHEDVTVFYQSPVLADAAHSNDVGHIIRAINSLDGETGLWNGEYRDDEARYYGIVTGYSGNAMERREHKEARNDTVPHPTSAELDALIADGKSVEASFSINQYGRIDWQTTEAAPEEFPAAGGEGTATHVHGTIMLKETVEEKINDDALPEDNQPTEPGFTTDLNFSITKEGRFNWTAIERESQEYPAGGAGLVTWSYGPHFKEKKTTGKNTDAPPIAADPGTYPVGSITRTDFGINVDGLLDWSVVVESGIESAEKTGIAGGPLNTITKTERLNSISVPTVGPGTAGIINSLDFRINQYGLIDWSKIEDAATPFGPIETNYGGVVVSVLRQEYRNASAPDDPGAGGAGEITSEDFSINQYGLFDKAVSVESAHKVGPVDIEFGSVLAVNTHAEAINDTSPNDVGAGTQGIITSASFSINRFGLYDWSTDTDEAQMWPAGGGTQDWKTGGYFEQAQHKQAMNQTALPAGIDDEPDRGHIIGLDFNVNRYGLFDWTSTDRSFENVADANSEQADIQFDDHRVSRTETRKYNETALPSNFVAGSGNRGTIQRLDWRLNEYGYYDYTLTVLQQITDFIEHITATEFTRKVHEIVFIGWDTIPDISDAATECGVSDTTHSLFSINYSYNEFGLYDGTITVREPIKNVSGDEITTDDNEDIERTMQEHFNVETAPTGATSAEATDGITHTTYDRVTINEYGLYDYVEVNTTYRSPLGSLTTEVSYRLCGKKGMRTSTWSVDPDTGETLVAMQATQDVELHYMKVFAGAAAAAAYINQNDVAGSDNMQSGSGISDIGHGLWLAHKVINTTDDVA